MIRVNPFHDNTCWCRVGMYRSGQCTDGSHPCRFLSECEEHWDEKTDDWDYPIPRIAMSGELAHNLKVKEGGVYDTEISGIPFRD